MNTDGNEPLQLPSMELYIAYANGSSGLQHQRCLEKSLCKHICIQMHSKSSACSHAKTYCSWYQLQMQNWRPYSHMSNTPASLAMLHL